VIGIKEIARLEISLIDDRGFKKLRTNLVKNNRIFGFIKTI